jgi:hypothetical protein
LPEILARYGALRPESCFGVGVKATGEILVILTSGLSGGPGAIAMYRCQPDDATCNQGRAPSAPGASWSVFPAPHPGPVTIIGGDYPQSLLIDNGGWLMCFDMTTHAYEEWAECQP